MDITEFVGAVLTLIGIAITTFLIPYIKTKTNKEEQQMLSVLVQTAVQAAEQIFVGTGLGQKKKEWVLEYLTNHGIKINIDSVSAEIDAMIEAAVYAMKNK